MRLPEQSGSFFCKKSPLCFYYIFYLDYLQFSIKCKFEICFCEFEMFINAEYCIFAPKTSLV